MSITLLATGTSDCALVDAIKAAARTRGVHITVVIREALKAQLMAADLENDAEA